MRNALLLALLLALPAFVLTADARPKKHRRPSTPVAEQQKPTPAPGPVQVASDGTLTIDTPAKFVVIMDYDTGALLFSKNGDQLMKPASMAKLLTISILFEKLKRGEVKLDDTFAVSETAWRQSITEKSAASKMFVQVGDTIRVEDLVRGIVIQSGNDASIVVAEHIAGSEPAFAQLMNAEAKRMGLTHSTFTNSNGLPDPAQNVTAHDLALAARFIIRNFPDYYHYFAEPEFTYANIKQYNRNTLLGSYAGADGLKTGHTAESGYGMTASAVQGGRRLIVVVNGLTSESERAAEVKRLFDIGFREFNSYALLKPGDAVGEAEVWAGELRTVPLTVKEPVNVMMRRAARSSLRVTLKYNEPVLPPVARGAQLGTLIISAPGIPDRTVPVYAGADVDSGGIFTNMKLGLKALLSEDSKPAPQTETPAAPAPDASR